MKTKIIKLINILVLILFCGIYNLQTSAQCGLQNIPGLQSVIIHEKSGAYDNTEPFTYDSSKILNRLPGTLNSSNKDFGGVPYYANGEYYDLFYSDANGLPNPIGNYLTIEGEYLQTSTGGGFNIAEVELVINSVSIYAYSVQSYVGIGPYFDSLSVNNILGNNLSTWTTMGNTTPSYNPSGQRMRITVGFNLPACSPMVIQANVVYRSACKGCVLIILSGGCTPYTYSWTGPNGYTSSTKNPCSLDPGTYNLTVTDAGGCHATKTVIVNPPAPVLNLTVNNHDYPTCCPILNVSGVNANSCSYNWTGPCITNSTIQNPCPVTCDGLYCVTVTTNIGCTASACVERKCHDCSDTLCKYWAVGGNSSTNGGHIDGTYNLDNILGINDVGLNGNTPPNPGNTNLSPLRIFTNSTEQVRILSTGQVGIGTTTPTATLDVLGFQVNADERNFRVRSRDGGNLGNNGNLVNTELSGLTHSPANVPPLPGVSWTALFARQGNASKAGTFVGDVTIMGDPNVGGANGASIGTLGVGTITPTEKLHVHNGSIFITGAARQGGPMILFGDDGIIKTGHPDGNWGIEYEPTYGGLNFWKPFGSAGGFANNLLFLKDNGNVGIGTPKPTEKLFVCGNITATGNITAGGLMTATVLKISNTPIDCPTFPDYVFNKNYKLMTLKEVEEYIVSNHHLPNVPSASDIKTNGIDVAKMSFNQLEKVEELYLHVIELNKSIEQLKAANEELQAQMKKLVKK